MAVIYTLASVVLVSLISFVGVLALSLKKLWVKEFVYLLIALAVGVLLGDAFIHVIPESIERADDPTKAVLIVLGGFLIFFIIEKLVHFHHAHLHADAEKYHPVVVNNLISDALHNFTDGVLIAGTYVVDLRLGIATTIAVILHEIPQEISDFGVLIHGGMEPRKALVFNFFSAVTAVLGAVVTLLFIDSIGFFETWLLPIAAGGFIYIATADLIPELHRQTHVGSGTGRDNHQHGVNHFRSSVEQVLMISLGIFLMWLLLFLEVE